MARQLIKGNEAVVKGAILAGCRYFFGYPITPASEIAHAAALYMPEVGGTFIQAESEIAAIQMVYGAACAGARVMTASSGPGISLKCEGISYMAGAELPGVIIDVMRGGPGLGNIAPDQGDYNQIVKGGGHGNYHVIALAPNSCQEMCDLTALAFDLADKYRNPVVVLSDAFIGQMMEPVEFPEARPAPPEKPWRVGGTRETRNNLVTSIEMVPEEQEEHVRHLIRKYDEVEENETRHETYKVDGADTLLVGYGVVSRVLQSAVDQAREQGMNVGLFRPITLWPFPKEELRALARKVNRIHVVEMSFGQMVDDVRLTVGSDAKVDFYGRYGGVVPSVEEILDNVLAPTEV
ncbi:MAG: 3-methyl-2-oxobutanoate dehydrogenase subunit VorB [Candidatus Eisenbacteria sp.]|nr:3-methyl-2-oxobutanoate dehydrogenase subunit VorB [Candidatus Eisenbacteria bacterium]